MTAPPPVANLEARSLVKKLCRILKAIDHIEKKGRNKEQGYDFVRESDVKAELRSLFAEENVWPSPDVEDASYVEFPTKSGGVMHFCRLKVRITFEDGDTGETRSCRVMGEAMDSGDKASNKALTAAVKVALLQSMLIPTGDDTENDQKPEKHTAKPQPPAPPKPTEADIKVLVDSFAALGVTVAELDKRLGWPVATMSAGDMVGLRKFYAEKRAAAKNPDAAAQEAVKQQAETAMAAFARFVDRIKTAKTEHEVMTIHAESAAVKWTKGDAAALARAVTDRVFLLKEAAKPATQSSGDVPF